MEYSIVYGLLLDYICGCPYEKLNPYRRLFYASLSPFGHSVHRGSTRNQVGPNQSAPAASAVSAFG